MASVAKLKNRIRSVSSIEQVTGAMELVSASKMRRAVKASLDTQPFHSATGAILMHLAADGAKDKYGFFEHRDMKTRLLLVISSDTGLAGAYNSNIFKRLIAELEKDQQRQVRTKIIAIGRKVSTFVSRLGSIDIIGSYELSTIKADTSQREAVRKTIFDAYKTDEIQGADIIFTEFRSAMNQEVRLWHLLPAGHIPGIDIPCTIVNSTFEPSRGEVMDAALDWILEAQIVQAFLDSEASEHSQRMMAMKNATDNASDLVEDLMLVMNKERQSSITNELIDINAGAEAVS
jgi:F-type H+-transporting ATPase subunit gamma